MIKIYEYLTHTFRQFLIEIVFQLTQPSIVVHDESAFTRAVFKICETLALYLQTKKGIVPRLNGLFTIKSFNHLISQNIKLNVISVVSFS